MPRTIPIPRNFLPAVAVPFCFVIKAFGKGMTPKISNGDHLVCFKTKAFKDGDIAILKKGKTD